MQSEFKIRREKIIKAIGDGNIAIITSAPEIFRNGDAHFYYRQNSDFYYLTGFNEPSSIALLIPNGVDGEYILFNRPHNKESEVWTGCYAGQEGAVKNHGADIAYDIAEFERLLPSLLQGKKTIYYDIGHNEKLESDINHAVQALTQKVRQGLSAPINHMTIRALIDPMRLLKSEKEITFMRKAAQISAKAHIRAMKSVIPGMMEYELEAELLHEFYRSGCRAPAYSSIVASGDNACTLHYVDNHKKIQKDDLVLIDAGGEYEMYASDISRTFPASGTFSNAQRALYELVLEAQTAAIDCIKPGVTWDEPQRIIVDILTEGLLSLNILHGDKNELINDKAYEQFYMHRSGHWLGMDVHDVGQYKEGDAWVTLSSGMVFTVEPGLYISLNHPNVDKKYRGMGIRIEDDILVTSTGCDVLSKDVPKGMDEIENLMA